MGASNSTLSTLVDGSSEGYHVLSVYENSPGAEAKLQAYFDFIIAVGEFSRISVSFRSFNESGCSDPYR